MSQFIFQQITHLEEIAIEKLRLESEEEGYHFISRLVADWQNNRNRFAEKGEGFYGVFVEEELIAIGGINHDPYIESGTAGRLRRFYVKQSWRRQRIGLKLLYFILQKHKEDFNEITLFTDTKAASLFYESIGFEKVSGRYKISHRQNITTLLQGLKRAKI